MFDKAHRELEAQIREDGENAAMDVGVHGIHPELLKLLGRMKFRSSYGQNALRHSIEVAQLSGMLAGEVGVDVRMAKRAGLLHDIGKSIDHEVEGSHIQIGVDLCKKYKESQIVINTVASHHGDCEPESLIACIVQAADAISAARPGARRETLETYTNRLKQLEDITNQFKGVDKSFAIQAGREIRVMVVPEHVNDADMVLLARDIAKQIEAELYQVGDQEFFQDHQTYQNLLGQLKEMGYSLSEAEQTDAYFFEKEERLRIERKKILKEKRIAERLREKAEEKENLEAQQKEKNM